MTKNHLDESRELLALLPVGTDATADRHAGCRHLCQHIENVAVHHLFKLRPALASYACQAGHVVCGWPCTSLPMPDAGPGLNVDALHHVMSEDDPQPGHCPSAHDSLSAHDCPPAHGCLVNQQAHQLP